MGTGVRTAPQGVVSRGQLRFVDVFFVVNDTLFFPSIVDAGGSLHSKG